MKNIDSNDVVTYIGKGFAFGSSEVDWCENNYDVSPYIAEFYNTVSNGLFFFYPPILIYLFRQYSKQVDSNVNIIWCLMAIVGLGSVYFHATLSLVGQLIDEIAIIWILFGSFGMWLPKRYIPNIFGEKRNNFKIAIFILNVICSGLAIISPTLNAIVLFILGIPTAILLFHELMCTQNPEATRLGIRCFTTWIIAVSSWVADRYYCNLWISIGFPYLHGMWHVFIAVASYQACVLFAYLNAEKDCHQYKPVLKFFPDYHYRVFCIPYVDFKTILKDSKDSKLV